MPKYSNYPSRLIGVICRKMEKTGTVTKHRIRPSIVWELK